ncbi:XVIPCD domain-containing protein [Neisseria sp. HMSC069H12]|jgi:hypothetical protein|uniref:XVIPCD domain-containing protein n=1 Tax=Neisseria sp. HMSC069H12 TaxID=1739376 RepID=UPI0008A10820|nr:XVIPCD domain-containing protein [Neisseria sp. HMSC069H12]OFR70792.1 hypothetical protein HMPREF2872_05945 [Neisseria sp. HMSC069H12]
MNNKKYTLTIYVAAPGTPLFDIDTGKPQLDEETKQQKTSLPGHVFYGISEDGGRTIHSYGFAPPKDTEKYHWYHPNKPGDVQKGEHKEYRNPVYERTMEITAEQYKALQKFGENPQNYGFNRSTYNWTTNSCIDFTFTALYRSGIYKGKEYIHHFEGVEVGRTRNNSHEGAIRVLPNIEEFDKIPNQMPDSNLNRTIKREMPSRTFGQWIVSENEREQPYQYAQAAGGFSPDLQPLHEKARTLLAECNQREGICQSETEFDNTAAYLTTAMQKAKMTDVDGIGRMDGKLHAIHDTEELDVAIVDPKTAAQTPVADSVAQSKQTEQQFEYETQQRQLAQSQSRGMMIS